MQAIYWQQYPWALGEVTCKARSLISEMTGYASVLTILAFSMERYLAICHPLYQYAMAGFSRAVKVLGSETSLLIKKISFRSLHWFGWSLSSLHCPTRSSLS